MSSHAHVFGDEHYLRVEVQRDDGQHLDSVSQRVT